MEDCVKKTNQIIFISAALVLMLMAGSVMAEKQGDGNLNRAVLKIDSLSCGGCFSAISAGMATLEGYSGMGANLCRKLIAIDFTAPLTPLKISQTLAEIGYPGKLQKVETISTEESFIYLESRRTGLPSGNGCCSGRNPGANEDQGPGSSGTPSQPGGSCCDLPGISQPTQNL